jgi:DNA invertase Pin-like site-specific DNA recombinase
MPRASGPTLFLGGTEGPQSKQSIGQARVLGRARDSEDAAKLHAIRYRAAAVFQRQRCRRNADALAVLEEFKDQGVGLHMIDLGGDVCGNGISKMVFTILAAVAEGERDRLRERIRDAKRRLASQGVFGGGKRPFGYDVVLDGEVSRLAPNAAEMATIERMRAMRLEGATYREIGEATGLPFKSVARILGRALLAS